MRSLLLPLILCLGAVRAPDSAAEEKHEFRAEVGRLMDIIINSLYTEKEIFLRELISNASDALDKLKYQALLSGTDPGELEIRVDWDDELKWVSIRDNGIGMTKADLVQHLGTIAKTGTTQFVEALKGGDINLIGQFGVGFYSAFLVGSKVQVRSKHANDRLHIWESESAKAFTVSEDNGTDIPQGTEVKIFLKEDAYEFSNSKTLEKYIKKYSAFVHFPIYLNNLEKEEQKVEKTEEEFDQQVRNKTEERRLQMMQNNETFTEQEEDKVYSMVNRSKTIQATVLKWTRVNPEKVLWMRDKADLKTEDYEQFYKDVFMGTSNLGTYSHFRTEGDIEFTGLLFVQERAPFDLYDKYFQKKNILKLYVRRILISDQFEDLLPRWLNFVEGIVDSDTLTLNVNRQNLQQSRHLKAISKKLIKKAIEMLSSYDPDAEPEEEEVTNDINRDDIFAKKKSDQELRLQKFNRFEQNYGKNIRLGILEEDAHREQLAHLCRWHSTRNLTKRISLGEYIDRMKEGQEYIYYLGGENRHTLMTSPLIEKLLADGYEVVLGEDSLDEDVFHSLPGFGGKKIRNVASTAFRDPARTEESRKVFKMSRLKFRPLLELMKEVLADRVKEVRISERLVALPAAVVSDRDAPTANKLRLDYAGVMQASRYVPPSVLELNPSNPMIQEMLDRVETEQSLDSTRELILSLYYAARIHCGFPILEGAEYSERFFRIIYTASGLTTEDYINPIEIEDKDLEDIPDEPRAPEPEPSRMPTSEVDEDTKAEYLHEYKQLRSDEEAKKEREGYAKEYVEGLQAEEQRKEQQAALDQLEAEERAEEEARKARNDAL